MESLRTVTGISARSSTASRSREGRQNDQRIPHPHHAVGGTEPTAVGSHRHHPKRTLKLGNIEFDGRCPVAVGSNDAGPEGYGLHPPDALGTNVLSQPGAGFAAT